MRVAQLIVSIGDTGIEFNKAHDLGLEAMPATTPEGGLVRGGGTHFKSPEAKARYERLMSEANTIRERFKRRFVSTPFDSVFVIEEKGQAQTFLDQMEMTEDGLSVRVHEYNLTSDNEMDEESLKAWTDRVKTQFKRIPLGRGDEADEEGLQALEALSRCPVISPAVGEQIRVMVQQVRVGQLKRVDLKRNIQTLDLTLDQAPLQPRRPQAEPIA